MKHLSLFSAMILLSASLVAQKRQTPPEYAAKSHQQHTMMLLGKLDTGGGLIATNANDIIYAFIDGECRGTANPMSEHDGLIFLSIAENTEQPKTISFMAWLDERQELLPLNETLSFEPLAAIGELNDPFIFTLGEMVGLDETTEGFWIGEAYPNPATSRTSFKIKTTGSAHMIAEIYNIFGQKVFEHQQTINVKSYIYQVETHWPEGVYNYILKIISPTSTLVKSGKIIQLSNNDQ